MSCTSYLPKAAKTGYHPNVRFEPLRVSKVFQRVSLIVEAAREAEKQKEACDGSERKSMQPSHPELLPNSYRTEGAQNMYTHCKKGKDCVNIAILDIDRQQDMNSKRGANVMLHVSTLIHVNFKKKYIRDISRNVQTCVWHPRCLLMEMKCTCTNVTVASV